MEQEEDFRADWLRGANTGNDYWVLAEAFIAAKREGKVGRKLVHFPPSRFPCIYNFFRRSVRHL
jgi:hypothetical protein